MAQDLVFDLELSLDAAHAKLDSMLARTQGKAKNAGKTAGSNFGSGFVAIASGIIAGMSFQSVVGSAMGAFNAFKAVSSANIMLGGAVKATNSRLERGNQVLTNAKSSIEQKAMALGLDTTKLYENAKASGGAGNATAGLESQVNRLENSLRMSERAFEDEQKVMENNLKAKEKDATAIDKQVKALKEKTDAQIKALQMERGFNTLSDEEKKLQIERNRLEIVRDEAKISGDLATQIDAENEIKILNDQISLRQNKLDAIEFETDAIKKQSDVQIAAFEMQKNVIQSQIEIIREEISDRKNKFDIDTTPAKRRIEDLQAQISTISAASSGGGGGGEQKVLKAGVADFIKQQEELAKKGPVPKIEDAKVQASVDEMVKKYGNYLSRQDLTKGYSDLLLSGLTDLGDIEKLTDNFINSAIAGKRDGISLGAAYQNETYGFKTENSAIANLSGLPENFEDINKRGLELLKEEAIAQGDLNTANRLGSGIMSDQEQVRARLLGTLEVTEDTQGALKRMEEEGLLAQEIAAKNIRDLQTAIGQGLAPAITDLINAAVPLIQMFTTFAKENPELVVTFFALVGAVTGLLTAALPLVGVFTLLSPMFTAVSTAMSGGGGLIGLFGMLSNPITIIIGIVLALIGMFVLFYTKVDWFRAGVNTMIENIKGYFASWSGNVGERVAEIIGFFLTLPIKLPLIMADAIGKIIAYLSNGDNWAKAWEGLTNSFSTALKWIEEQWKKIDFKAILRGLINGATKGTPLEGQTFGFSGGGYTGDGNPRAAAGIVHKNEAVLNPRQMSDLIFGIAKMGASNSQTNNNTTNYYGMDVNSGFKNPAFI